MKRKMIFGIGLVLLALTLACDITMEGINWSGDPSPEEIEKARFATDIANMQETWQAESGSSSVDGGPVAETSVPTTAAASSAAQPSGSTRTGVYSVQATNYDCICSVDGDVETTFNFKGDTLEVFHSPSVSFEYTKTGENTYIYSFMGYYILDGEKVDEQKHVVITFTDTGYTMQHFSGDLSSPCCVYTFTNK
jgi:hypothetical protein